MANPSPAAGQSPNSTAPPPFKIYAPGERPDENRGHQLLAVCVSLTVLADAIVVLRLLVRRKFIRSIGADDYLMVLAALVLTAMTGTIIAEVGRGAGRHVEYIPPTDLIAANHLNYATQPMCLIALTLARLSVCFFLLRLAKFNPYQRFLWFLVGVAIVLVIIFSLQTILQCLPVEYIWNKALPGGGYCIPPNILVTGAVVNSGIGAAYDFILAALPIPMLWSLQMNWRVKTAVIAILSLGFFTGAASIMKTISLTEWARRGNGDLLWDSADITLWCTAEIAVAIIAGSIPCLKPLFTGVLTSRSAKSTPQNGYGPDRSRQEGGGGGGGRRANKGRRSAATAAANAPLTPGVEGDDEGVLRCTTAAAAAVASPEPWAIPTPPPPHADRDLVDGHDGGGDGDEVERRGWHHATPDRRPARVVPDQEENGHYGFRGGSARTERQGYHMV